MSSYPLAIFAPQIGARSETFIRRHMEQLLPGQTVVVANTDQKPYAGHWGIDNPNLILDGSHIKETERFARVIRRKRGRPIYDPKVKRFLKQHDVHVIMAEWLDLGLPWFRIAQELDIRFFAHAHGYDISERLRDPFWREQYLKYNDAEGIITMSQNSRQRLVDIGIQSAKIHVVPYGVDVPDQFPERSQQNFINCLAVGRMVPKKAPILMLDSWRRAAEVCRHLKLDLVGEGELLPAAQEFVRAFGLTNRVQFHGGQPSSMIQQTLKTADIFVQHSIVDPASGDEEGLPISILEAMSQGLPVVSTKHAGIPEAVEDGVTGYLVEEGDNVGMAERIVQLARNPQLRRTMGYAAWERAFELFSWKQERSKLIEILRL